MRELTVYIYFFRELARTYRPRTSSRKKIWILNYFPFFWEGVLYVYTSGQTVIGSIGHPHRLAGLILPIIFVQLSYCLSLHRWLRIYFYGDFFFSGIYFTCNLRSCVLSISKYRRYVWYSWKGVPDFHSCRTKATINHRRNTETRRSGEFCDFFSPTVGDF